MKVYICAAWTRRLVSYFLFFQSSGPIWILKELRYSCSPRTDQQNTQAAEVADHWRITLSNDKPPAENNTHDSCRTVDLMRSFITLTPAFWRRECPLNLSAPGVLNIQESCWRSQQFSLHALMCVFLQSKLNHSTSSQTDHSPVTRRDFWVSKCNVDIMFCYLAV